MVYLVLKLKRKAIFSSVPQLYCYFQQSEAWCKQRQLFYYSAVTVVMEGQIAEGPIPSSNLPHCLTITQEDQQPFSVYTEQRNTS